MLIIQQNYRKGYKCTIFALEIGLGLNVRVICIQEPFLEKKNLAYARFNLYWLARHHNRKDNRVFIAIHKDLLNKTIAENQIDLINYPYSIVLDITKREILAKKQKRKTRIFNVYDNKLGEGQTWQGLEQEIR